MLAKIVEYILRPIWIVTEEGELGFRIWGVNFSYYKWAEPMLNERSWRRAEKREFGEVVYSVKEAKKGRDAQRTLLGLPIENNENV